MQIWQIRQRPTLDVLISCSEASQHRFHLNKLSAQQLSFQPAFIVDMPSDARAWRWPPSHPRKRKVIEMQILQVQQRPTLDVRISCSEALQHRIHLNELTSVTCPLLSASPLLA
jgi:hypothetical protein